MSKRSEKDRWVDEPFLRRACEAIRKEVDWDSIDSGRLHWTTVAGKTETGQSIIVGVLSEQARFSEVLDDADKERTEEGLSGQIALWLYVPEKMDVPEEVPDFVIIKRIR